MAQTERELLDELVLASTNLCTVADNAAVVLSEEFESMITGPLAAVQEVLKKCPKPSSFWDGEFRIEDCDIEQYTPDAPPGVDRTGVGCRITHRHTGKVVEAHQKPEFQLNKQTAQRALADLVRRNYSQRPSDPLHSPRRG